MTDAANAIDAGRIHLVSCVGVSHDGALLDRFIAHYLALGVPARNFHLILNARSDETPALVSARAILAARDVPPATEWIAPYTSDDMWQQRRDMQRVRVPADDWLISADIDEFHEYPTRLSRFLAYCEARRINCVDGVLVDRLATDGSLASIDESTPLDTLFPERRILQGSVFRFGTTHNVFGSLKIMAVKGRFLLDRGGHAVIQGEPGQKFLYGRHIGAFDKSPLPGFRAQFPTRVHHFKWTDTLRQSLDDRLATPGTSTAGRAYGSQILAALDATGQRIDPEAATPVPYRAGRFGLLRIAWIRRREKLRRKMRKKWTKLTRRLAG